MYYVMRASAPSLHRESTDSLITSLHVSIQYTILFNKWARPGYQCHKWFECFDALDSLGLRQQAVGRAF